MTNQSPLDEGLNVSASNSDKPPEKKQTLDTSTLKAEDVEFLPLPPLQNAARGLLIGLASFGGIVIVGVLLHWLLTAPIPPTTYDQAVLERYKSLSDIHNQIHKDIFQSVITTTIVPIVTTLIGYLFGVNARNAN